MREVSTPGAPAPNGHYSQALVHGGIAFLSMQLPIAVGGATLDADIASQTEQVMRNCEAVLECAGSGLDEVLSVVVYLTRIGDWSTVDRICARRFANHKPARSVIAVEALHLGAQVGMQMIGAVTTRDNDGANAQREQPQR